MSSVTGRGSHPWSLDEATARTFIRAGARGGHQLLRHRQRLLRRHQRGVHRPGAGRARRRDDDRARDQGARPDAAGPERRRPVAQGDPPRDRRRACAGSAPTTSTSTRSTGGTATPIEETMEALHDVVRAGKVRYLGASSMYAWQFAKAQHVAERNGWTPFVAMQDHYNLLNREEEREMLPLCLDQGVGVIPWSPLARGRLTRAGRRRPRAARPTSSASASTPRRPDGRRRGGRVADGAVSPRPGRAGLVRHPASPRRSSAPPSHTT